jgi:uncharacterized membrane protein YeaQ/YmgE (transglycosylase-associated protein family)
MGIIAWIIFGGLVGWIASKLMGTNAQMGVGMNIVVGVVGAVIGGLLFSILGGVGVTGFNLYSFVVALIGAMVLLAIVKAARK